MKETDQKDVLLSFKTQLIGKCTLLSDRQFKITVLIASMHIAILAGVLLKGITFTHLQFYLIASTLIVQDFIICIYIASKARNHWLATLSLLKIDETLLITSGFAKKPKGWSSDLKSKLDEIHQTPFTLEILNKGSRGSFLFLCIIIFLLIVTLVIIGM